MLMVYTVSFISSLTLTLFKVLDSAPSLVLPKSPSLTGILDCVHLFPVFHILYQDVKLLKAISYLSQDTSKS